jgi:hypothetical protein
MTLQLIYTNTMQKYTLYVYILCLRLDKKMCLNLYISRKLKSFQ